jgi:hypothetical protein
MMRSCRIERSCRKHADDDNHETELHPAAANGDPRPHPWLFLTVTP